MLYNFTHTHIGDLWLQLCMEKLANSPKLIGRTLKMIKLEGAVTEKKLYSMGPSVIINTFIFYNCCFLHAQTSSLLGPQGPGGTSVCPHANTPPRPVGSVPALCAGLRPTICQMPAGSALCRRGERNQTHSRPCVQQVTFQTVSKRALDPETSKLQCFHCLNQPSEKTHVCTI